MLGHDTRFEIGDNLFVNSQEDSHGTSTESSCKESDTTFWVATVLEIRASSQLNVLVRVEWFYRPDCLPDGPQPYHGMREIIKSAREGIINAHSVSGPAKVTHWDENVTQDVSGTDGLFWRQTFNHSAGALSVFIQRFKNSS